MYLSATHGAISVMLLTDRDSVQTPVYFVSKALKETEINYSAMEKLILALVFAAKRLRRYFQVHPIVVIIDQPQIGQAQLSKQVLVEILKDKSISKMEISTVIKEQDPTWMTPIIEFITKGTLPHEQSVLYRRSFLQPWLR
ncbi:reverse transcriptase domain-containing protein, partial [Tanacetum coccineum]